MKIIIYKKGVTLIEALFVLGIMAILIGMVMYVYNQAINKDKANQMAIEAILIANVSNQLRVSIAPLSMTNITSEMLAKSGFIPNKYVASDLSGLIDPYGVPIQIFVDNDSTAINFNHVNSQACQQLALYDYGQNLKALQLASSGVITYVTPKTAEAYCHFGNAFVEVDLYE